MRLAAHPGLRQSKGVNQRIISVLELHQVITPGLFLQLQMLVSSPGTVVKHGRHQVMQPAALGRSLGQASSAEGGQK